MATVERTMGIDRTTVWEALLEPETYPHWLVGAQDIRAVDAAWPARGRPSTTGSVWPDRSPSPIAAR